MFWTLAILGTILLLHCAVLLTFALLGSHPPDVLLLPRGEMLVSLLLTIPLIQASVTMLFGSARDVALGCATLLLPVGFLLMCFTLIWYHVYYLPLPRRGAHYVVQDRVRSHVARKMIYPRQGGSEVLEDVPEE